MPLYNTQFRPTNTFYTLSANSLAIDGQQGSFFIATLSSGSAPSFTFSNLVIGEVYYFMIKNTYAGALTLTLPNTADVKATTTVYFSGQNKYRELSMTWDGTTRYWQISEELS